MVDTIGKLRNKARLDDEESSIFRTLISAAALPSDDNSDIIMLHKGITNGKGGFGTFRDFLRCAMEATAEEDQKQKMCLKAIDSSVMDQEGAVGDLWQFVIAASDGRKISVSGWGY